MTQASIARAAEYLFAAARQQGWLTEPKLTFDEFKAARPKQYEEFRQIAEGMFKHAYKQN